MDKSSKLQCKITINVKKIQIPHTIKKLIEATVAQKRNFL